MKNLPTPSTIWIYKDSFTGKINKKPCMETPNFLKLRLFIFVKFSFSRSSPALLSSPARIFKSVRHSKSNHINNLAKPNPTNNKKKLEEQIGVGPFLA